MWRSFIQIHCIPLYPCLFLSALSNTCSFSSLFFPFLFPGFSFLSCYFMCDEPPLLSYAGYDTLIARIWKNLTQHVKVSDVLWCAMEYVTFFYLTDLSLLLAREKKRSVSEEQLVSHRVTPFCPHIMILFYHGFKALKNFFFIPLPLKKGLLLVVIKQKHY